MKLVACTAPFPPVTAVTTNPPLFITIYGRHSSPPQSQIHEHPVNPTTLIKHIKHQQRWKCHQHRRYTRYWPPHLIPAGRFVYSSGALQTSQKGYLPCFVGVDRVPATVLFCPQVPAKEALDGKHVAFYFSSQAVEDQLEKAAQGQETVRPTPVVKEVSQPSLERGSPFLAL